MADGGASADQLEYYAETSKNNEALANGGELSGLTYESVAPTAESIVRETVPDFKPSDVHTIPEDASVKLKTFRSVAINYFKTEHEDDPDLTAEERVDKSIRDAMDDMNIDVEANPDMANAFIQSGMEGILQYRESEGTTNMHNIQGLVAMNLVNSRDLLNKTGFDASSVDPSTLIDNLQKSQGFRNLTVISDAALAQGDDGDLLTALSQKLHKINPMMDDAGISEIERKNLVKKNFLDVLGSRLLRTNVPPAQKVQMIHMLEKIDSDIDGGNADPMVNSMLEHVYQRFTDGFSTYKSEERITQNLAAGSGRGVIRDTRTGKLLQTSTDFAQQVSKSRSFKDQAVNGYYNQQVQNVSNGAGFEFVKSVADSGDGVLAFSNDNKQFYFGSVGANALNVGLSRLMDGIVQNKPLEKISPAFANPQANENASQVLRNVAALNAKQSINSSKGSLFDGLFMKSGSNNPIDDAGIELEKFGDYYVPESVGKMFAENPTVQMSDLKQAALKSPLGGKAVLGSVLQVMQMQAQNAANKYNKQLTGVAEDIYPNSIADASGTRQPLYKVAMTQENDDFETNLPELGNGLPYRITPEIRDNLTKYREDVENRISILQVGLDSADLNATDDQKAMFSGTEAEMTGKNFKATIGKLSEMRDILNDIENLPSENYSKYEGVGLGYDSAFRIIQESARAKRVELSDRLMVLKSDMNKASL